MEEAAPAGGNTKKRVAWLDVSRCIAMYFILWLHAGAPDGWLDQIIGGALFLFFFWAGYFMPQQAGKCAVRALKLALVWVIWSLLAWGNHVLLCPNAPVDWARVVGWGASSYNTPLWFLRVLFLSQLIMAGLLALRVLPRFKWLLLVVLAGFSYAKGLRQHEALSFSWMMVVVLGFCLRGVPLEAIRQWLARNAVPLLIIGMVWYAQWTFYPKLLGTLGLKAAGCGLPLLSLAWATVFSLAAIAIEAWLPRLARLLAPMGACMIFCYVAHHIFYTWTIYGPGIRFATNFWVPFIALPFLTWLYLTLSRRFPRTMGTLCGK